jgi:thymidine phosphorylase
MIEFDPDVRGGDGWRIARDILESGRALSRMNAIIDAQGRREPPPPAALVFDVPAPRAGMVIGVDNLRIARIARLTGAPQVPTAGVDLFVRLGDRVEAGQPLYRLHARYEADLGFARQMALADAGWQIGEASQLPRDVVDNEGPG